MTIVDRLYIFGFHVFTFYELFPRMPQLYLSDVTHIIAVVEFIRSDAIFIMIYCHLYDSCGIRIHLMCATI